MPEVTSYKDETAISARQIELPNADFQTGLNAGGSNAGGIGIDIDGGEVSVNDFTLLDQDGDPRTPQKSQQLGGTALSDGTEGKGTQPIASGEPNQDHKGEIVQKGEATLADLATGWDSVTPP